jgi:hypothetical protein
VITLPRTRGGWRCVIADPAWSFNDRNTRGVDRPGAPYVGPAMLGDQREGEMCATLRSNDVRRIEQVPCSSIRADWSLYEDFDPAIPAPETAL